MAQLDQVFDATQVEPTQPHEVLPPGDYQVQIINSEMRANQAGTGQYLWMEMDVLQGAHAGRKVYDRLNLSHPNQKAVEIAQRTLSAICHALSQLRVLDSEQLHFQPMTVKVTVGKSGYNEVKGYKAAPPAPVQQAAPTSYQQAAPPATQPPAPAQAAQGVYQALSSQGGQAPWNRV